MADRIFEYDKLQTNEYAKIIIAGLGGKETGAFYQRYQTSSGRNRNTVVGYIQNPINITGGNTYDEPFTSSAQENLTGIARKATAAVSKIGGKSMAHYSIKNFEQTASAWTGSAKPSFTFDLAFVALRENDDVTLPVKSIMKAFYPSAEKNLMRAPLGYGFKSASGGFLGKLVPRASLTIQVGKWFRAYYQIPDNASFAMSKECIKSGKPLYATGSITVSPFRMITYSELMSYFVG